MRYDNDLRHVPIAPIDLDNRNYMCKLQYANRPWVFPIAYDRQRSITIVRQLLVAVPHQLRRVWLLLQ